MAVAASWINKRDLPTGAEMTLLLVDGAGVYSNARIDKHFGGRTVAQCTDAFLLTVSNAEIAAYIQRVILAASLVTIQGIAQAQFDLTVAPAMQTAITSGIAQLSPNNVTAAQIATKITNAWAAYGVTGAIGSPVVALSLSRPTLEDFNITVAAQN